MVLTVDEGLQVPGVLLRVHVVRVFEGGEATLVLRTIQTAFENYGIRSNIGLSPVVGTALVSLPGILELCSERRFFLGKLETGVRVCERPGGKARGVRIYRYSTMLLFHEIVLILGYLLVYI